MTAPLGERGVNLNRIVGGVARPTRRGGETLARVSKERQELIDSLMPSSVSFGVVVNEPTPNRSLIERFRSVAAGFVVSSESDEVVIATNRHVYQDSRKENLPLRIMSSKRGADGGDRDGRMFNAEIAYVSQDHDIAFYSIKKKDYPDIDLQQELPEAPLGTIKEVRSGGEIIAFGSPMSLDWTTKVGYVTHDELIPVRTQYGKGRSDLFIQMDAHLQPGNSGGMIVSSETGMVIGMGTAMLGVEDGRGNLIEVTDTATPVDYISSELAHYKDLKTSGALPMQQLQRLQESLYQGIDLPEDVFPSVFAN